MPAGVLARLVEVVPAAVELPVPIEADSVLTAASAAVDEAAAAVAVGAPVSGRPWEALRPAWVPAIRTALPTIRAGTMPA